MPPGRSPSGPRQRRAPAAMRAPFCFGEPGPPSRCRSIGPVIPTPCDTPPRRPTSRPTDGSSLPASPDPPPASGSAQMRTFRLTIRTPNNGHTFSAIFPVSPSTGGHFGKEQLGTAFGKAAPLACLSARSTRRRPRQTFVFGQRADRRSGDVASRIYGDRPCQPPSYSTNYKTGCRTAISAEQDIEDDREGESDDDQANIAWQAKSMKEHIFVKGGGSRLRTT